MKTLKPEHIAHEAFIRRAAQIEMPFMLKGSYISRQYFPKNVTREAADLDWVYMDYLDDPVEANEQFDEWLIAITELEMNDGIKFRSFRENRFWRMIDYAMADDFPTVNTDVLCWVDGEELELRIDMSFNLDVEQPPIPLLYSPDRGEPFEIPFTVPLSLQISWKIHQTIVRPRFKDLFDLANLVKHSSFDQQTLSQTLQALVNECAADNVDMKRLEYFLRYDFEKLFPKDDIIPNWRKWRNNSKEYGYIRSSFLDESASSITDPEYLPDNLNDFLSQISESLKNAGIGIHLMNQLPKPARLARKNYRDLSNTYLRWNADVKPYGEHDRPVQDPSAGIKKPGPTVGKPAIDMENNSPIESPKKPGFLSRVKKWFNH